MNTSCEDFCILGCQACYSPTDMSFPTSAQTSNDLPGSSPSISSTLSVIDHLPVPLTLDSFIPILSHLPGLYLDQNLYHFRGSITKADWARLRDYTQMVSKFIVTDIVKKDSDPQISPATFLRIARLQQSDMPLLPSLSDLVIVDADTSIAYLELLLTPSLKSLKASCIPDAQQATFFSFLTAIEEEVPLLQTLILGPGRFLPGSIQIISQFNNLRHLELKNENSELPPALFDNISSFKLEILILDARYVSSPVSENESNSTEEPTAPTTTIGGFTELVKLHVVGWLPLLKDLIPRIMSTKLEDVSVTLIRLSNYELKEEKRREEENLLREQAEEKKRREELRTAEGKSLGEETEQERKYEEERRRERLFGTKIKKEPIATSRERERREREKRERLEEELRAEKRREEKKEQDRVALVSKLYTVPFTELLRMLWRRCTTSLKIVSICQLDRSFRPLSHPPTLPEVFRELLLLPVIESLEMNGWMLDSIESVLNAIELIPNLKSLLLPLDETNSGISLPTLRRIAETCPKLESFQCRIEPLSLIPEYAIPATNALSHGLRILSVGNSSPLPSTKQLYPIARHLYLLFPNLETINTSKKYNEEQWSIIDDLVKMCQTARKDDMNRPSTSITQ